MKILKILLIFMILPVCWAGSLNEQDKLVNEVINNYMEKNHIPGVAVQLYIDGKPSSYYFGYANRDKKQPVTSQTIFELGSISKVMTSLLFAQEVDAAKMQLNDSLTKFMPNLPETYQDITLKSLATHTSGLPFKPPASVDSSKTLEQYLQTWKPTYEVEDEWIYSNFGIGMLSYSLEKFTHNNINQLYLNKIAKPLRMQPIGLNVPKKLLKFCAQGYDEKLQPVKPLQMKLFPAAGGMKASANDMQLFLRAAIGLPGTPDRIFYPMRMTQAVYVELPEKMQGLGWEVNDITSENFNDLLTMSDVNMLEPLEVEEVLDQPTFDGNRLIDKTGTTDGFRAYIALIPNKKSGIVILANKRAIDSEIAKAGREILFKLAHVKPKVVVDSDKSS